MVRTRYALALTAAVCAAGLACGPSNVVTPGILGRDAGGGRPVTPDRRTDGAAPTPYPTEDAGADAPPDLSAPAQPDAELPDLALPPDRPVDAALTPDLPPDVRLPPDLAPDLPPDLPPDTAPPGPYAMVSHAPAQPLTNLTMLDAMEWAHFGHGGVTAVNRKMGSTMRLTVMPVGGGPQYPYDDRPVRFSWTDGTPTAQVASTPQGISNGDAVGRGFELRVEGDVARPRTLRLYWGVWGARAQFTARFSNQTMPVFTDSTITAGNPGQDRITTITFRPGASGQALLVRWTVEAINLQYGNVTLQAAALSE